MRNDLVFKNFPARKVQKMLADVSEKCGVAPALEPIRAELTSNLSGCESARTLKPDRNVSSSTLQNHAQEDSGTEIDEMSWETELMSWSERARSKPTRESGSQVKRLQQRHLYAGRGASHLGCPRSCWANPFTVKQHGFHRANDKFEEMLNNTPSLLQKLGQLTNRVLLCHCEKEASCHSDVLIRAWEKTVPERSRPRNTTRKRRKQKSCSKQQSSGRTPWCLIRNPRTNPGQAKRLSGVAGPRATHGHRTRRKDEEVS